jgi:hypothetical protein
LNGAMESDVRQLYNNYDNGGRNGCTIFSQSTKP